MHRYFVTGTDTDVGKTRVVAAIAHALRQAGVPASIVKIVQTGVRETEAGDAVRAGALAGCTPIELARFESPFDPWSAALAEGRSPLTSRHLEERLNAISGSVVVEGSGGIAVPLNECESLALTVQATGLRVILVVGLRLGCINHALLSLAMCDNLQLNLVGFVLVERWHAGDPQLRQNALRALQQRMTYLGTLPYNPDEQASVLAASTLFTSLLGLRNK